MKNLILCGGFGTRLWPLSRKLMPKQFLKLFSDKSLFQLTLARNTKLCDSFIISVNEEQYFLASDQIEELTIDYHYSLSSINYILETEGKNTAPAIAFAAFASDKEDILFVTPSDHFIKNQDEYEKAVITAKRLAEENYLVTFGIEPKEPNTGYGYIEVIENSDSDRKKNMVFEVVRFYEKPNLETAQKYIDINHNSQLTNHDSQITNHYLWNSGMFMFKAGVYLEELQKHSPEAYEACMQVYKKHIKPITNNQLRITNMQDIPNISIDYAVMEKSDRIKAVKSEFEWNDVGSFDSLIEEVLVNSDSDKGRDSKYESENVSDRLSEIEIDSKNNFYYKDKNKIIATIGLEDFIVIDTKDALLIAKKGQTQKVKNLVEQLKRNSQALSTITNHYIVHRPWGTYETLVEGKGYKIKRIIVKPGKRLSLQKHFHRNEHWIVVKGTALVQVEDKEYLVRPNESTYIKMGQLHRLSNPGKTPVVLIEAQVGEYVGEDDIVRVEDDYQRI